MMGADILAEICKYAEDCISDRIPSCTKHKKACARLLRDVTNMKTDPDYPYYFDNVEAAKIIEWFAMLRHSKGELAGQPINLTPWQKFNLCQLYGWKRKSDGRRRFRRMFLEVARKNAKSQMLSGIALYECAVISTKNKEAGEIYTAGTKRQQSRIVLDECRLMLNGSPLKKFFKITRTDVRHIKSSSFVQALSKDDGRKGDGTNPACLILDEYHQHASTEFYDLAIGSNTKEPLLIIITTAGVDLSYPCYREYQFCSQVLDPNVDITADDYLIDICEQDPEDYTNRKTLQNENLWTKSNPIRASYPEGRRLIRQTYEKALQIPEEMPSCLTKCFDIWVQHKQSGYMDMSAWKKCEVPELPVDITGIPCVVGLDLSAKIDLCSICFCIPFLNEDKRDAAGEPMPQYILLQHSFVPNRQKLLEREASDKVPYTAWEQQGWLSITDSQIVDQNFVKLWVKKFAEDHGLHIETWAFDPHNSALFMSSLSDEGEDVFEVYQSFSGLNDATIGLREEIIQGNVYHLADPLFSFCMSNAVVRSSDGRIKIDKDAAAKRIDPIDASICAFKVAQLLPAAAKAQKDMNAAIDKWLAEDW